MEFLSRLREPGKSLIIHHWDTDGVCSAALLYDHLREKNPATCTPSLGSYNITEDELSSIRKGGYGSIVIVDLNLPEQEILRLREVSRAEVFIFDHHVGEPVEGVFHLNPVIMGEPADAYPSCSWVVTKYLGVPLNLLSVLGAVADNGPKIMENNPVAGDIEAFLEGMRLGFDDLLAIAELVDSNFRVDDKRGVEEAVFTLLRDKDSPEALLGNVAWRGNVAKLTEEMATQLDKPPVYDQGGVAVYEVNSRHNITSALARKLVWERGRNIVVVLNAGFSAGSEQIYVRGKAGRIDAYRIISSAKRHGYSAGGKADVVGIILPKGEGKRFLQELLSGLKG